MESCVFTSLTLVFLLRLRVIWRSEVVEFVNNLLFHFFFFLFVFLFMPLCEVYVYLTSGFSEAADRSLSWAELSAERRRRCTAVDPAKYYVFPSSAHVAQILNFKQKAGSSSGGLRSRKKLHVWFPRCSLATACSISGSAFCVASMFFLSEKKKTGDAASSVPVVLPSVSRLVSVSRVQRSAVIRCNKPSVCGD